MQCCGWQTPRRVNLDADVNGYLKSWKVPGQLITAKRAVTLRELLSHTAGVTVAGLSGYDAAAPLPSLLQILDGKPPSDNAPIRIDTVPGTEWRYSGGGYVIIRQALEDVTGEPFSELLHASVLEPGGMRDSTFSQPLSARLQAEAAAPYGPNGQPVSTGARVYPELAPDGLWTTPSDLARYAMQVQRALAGAPGALLSVQTARLMLTPRRDHYGLGVIAGDDPEHWWFVTLQRRQLAIPAFVAHNIKAMARDQRPTPTARSRSIYFEASHRNTAGPTSYPITTAWRPWASKPWIATSVRIG